jgi:hypothetical protein
MWLRRFGYQDIQVGHGRFDFTYTVKGQPEEMVRTALLPVADKIVAIDELDIESDGRAVEAKLNVSSLRAAELSVLTDVCDKVANANIFAQETLKALPGARVRWPDDGGPLVVHIAEPFAVDFTFKLRNRRPITVASAEVLESRSGLKMKPGDAGLPPEIRALLRKSGAEAVAGHQRHVEIRWPGLCDTHEQLVCGARLLARLAAGPRQSIYR